MEVSVVTPTPPLAHRMLMMHFHLSGELKKEQKKQKKKLKVFNSLSFPAVALKTAGPVVPEPPAAF